MESTKHLAAPATATEIRRLLGITAEEMAAGRRLLRLTAGKNEAKPQSERPRPGLRTRATRKAVHKSAAAATSAGSPAGKARGATRPALTTAAPKPTTRALSKKVIPRAAAAATGKATAGAKKRATGKPGTRRTARARA
jgi:hypothetical protein